MRRQLKVRRLSPEQEPQQHLARPMRMDRGMKPLEDA